LVQVCLCDAVPDILVVGLRTFPFRVKDDARLATATFIPDDLTVITSDGQKHTFPRDVLWRAFVLGWSSEVQANKP